MKPYFTSNLPPNCPTIGVHLSVLCAILLLTLGAAAHGQESEEVTHVWSDTGEVTYVATGGNAEVETLGVRNSLVRTWEGATFRLDFGALRSETTTQRRFAVGSAESFRLRETSQSDLTAENYHLRGRYDRDISKRLFWFAGAGWERNEFAGIQNRFQALAGVGHVWFDDEAGHFRTDYGLTYVDQDDVVENPKTSDSFVGARLGCEYLRRFGSHTAYENLLILDGNADETSDYRADMINSLAVSMNDRLALKISLQLLYDNQPSLAAVPLLGEDGAETGTEVLAPLEELDTRFSVALVVNF